MKHTAEITTTAKEIIIKIPRTMMVPSQEGDHAMISRLRGLMRHSRFAKMGSVAAQHAAWRKEPATS